MPYYLSIGISVMGTAIFGVTILLLIYYLKRTRLQFYKQASQFHGPRGLPFLGNAMDFVGNTEDLLNRMVGYSKRYISPFRIWLGPELLIFICNPEHVKIVLTSEKAIEKSKLYRFFQPWVGNGLFSATGKIWRTHRKLIGPTFNLKILESFVPVFAAQSKILVEQFEKEVNGAEFEIFDYISLCGLDIICETAMNIKMEAQTKSDRTYIEAVHNMFAIVYQRFFKAWLHSDMIFEYTQLGKLQRESLKILHGFTDDVIKKRTEDISFEQNYQKSTSNKEDDEYDTIIEKSFSPKRKAYLDLLMELSQNELDKFSNLEVREEVDTMIVAGYDTTSHVISCVMLMLATYPDIQEKVYQELLEIYGNTDINDRETTHEDLPRMNYLERVIKETQRIFPITSAISRSLSADLNIGEYTLPKGCTALIDMMSIHRNERYWKDALKFDPDRFLPEEVAKRHPYSYIPFSAGPRNCIGLRFATMEIKTILATILRKYRLKKDNAIPAGDIRLKADTLVKPVEPIKLRIEKR